MNPNSTSAGPTRKGTISLPAAPHPHGSKIQAHTSFVITVVVLSTWAISSTDAKCGWCQMELRGLWL
jgi:hypothetical protein